jgi:Skp family chaperone for outer membrane proteins
MSVMSEAKISKVGTVSLNRLFGTIAKFPQMLRNVDARDELKEKISTLAQAIRRAIPTERTMLQEDLEASRMTISSDVHQLAVRQREKVVEEIKHVILTKAREQGLDLVIDSGQVSTVGTPILLYADEAMDLTDEVIQTMNEEYPLI